MRTILAACFVCLLVVSAAAPALSQSGDGIQVQYLKADTASTFPFSDAVRVGPMLYLSGMVAFDATGKAVIKGTIEEEARQVMENIKKVLERNGSSMDHVVKCTLILTDMKDWPAVNGVYRTYFAKDRLPARTALGASGLALGARVELECWATVK
jgi:2-iminobutanoate/2-iminopropanoate deaminase